MHNHGVIESPGEAEGRARDGLGSQQELRDQVEALSALRRGLEELSSAAVADSKARAGLFEQPQRTLQDELDSAKALRGRLKEQLYYAAAECQAQRNVVAQQAQNMSSTMHGLATVDRLDVAGDEDG